MLKKSIDRLEKAKKISHKRLRESSSQITRKVQKGSKGMKERQKERREKWRAQFLKVSHESKERREQELASFEEQCREQSLSPAQVRQSSLCAHLCSMIYLHGEETIREQAASLGFNTLLLRLTEERGKGRYCTNFAIFDDPFNRILYVVFRGSENMKDWVTNFKAVPAGFLNRVNVHSGVLTSMRHQYKARIEEAVKSFLRTKLTRARTVPSGPGAPPPPKQYEVIFCGHSLGGALSTALYLQWQRDVQQFFHSFWGFAEDVQPPLVSLFTFGAPLVVHAQRKEDLERTLTPLIDHERIFNFVNNFDVVPRLLGGLCVHEETLKRWRIQVLRKKRISKQVEEFRAIGRYFYFHASYPCEWPEDADEGLSSASSDPPSSDDMSAPGTPVRVSDIGELPAAPDGEPPPVPQRPAKTPSKSVVTKKKRKKRKKQWTPARSELYEISSRVSDVLFIPIGILGAQNAVADHSILRYDELLEHRVKGEPLLPRKSRALRQSGEEEEEEEEAEEESAFGIELSMEEIQASVRENEAAKGNDVPSSEERDDEDEDEEDDEDDYLEDLMSDSRVASTYALIGLTTCG